jgi:hypothetical protein
MSIRDCLKKSLFSLLVAGFVIVSINISGAQFLSAIPGIGNVDFGSVKVAPFVQVGYKNIGFNLNLPFTIIPIDQRGNPAASPPALDLKFRDAGVWMGSIGIDARLPSALFVSLRADGNATKNISVFGAQNLTVQDISPPYTWAGSGLQWWDVDGRVGYTFVKDWSVVGGVRYDKLTVGLSDPVDQTGTPVHAVDRYNKIIQDVVVQTWIPYIGLQLNGPNYVASLLYSPFASTQVVAPQSLTAWSTLGGVPQGSSLENYKFANTGSFLDGYFEYDVSIRDSLLFGLWTRGTWMRFSGNGDWNHLENWLADISLVVDPQSVTGTLTTYGLSGGISATLSF